MLRHHEKETQDRRSCKRLTIRDKIRARHKVATAGRASENNQTMLLELPPAHLRDKIQLIKSIIFLVLLTTFLFFIFSHTLFHIHHLLYFFFTFLFRTTRHVCHWVVSTNLYRQYVIVWEFHTLLGKSLYKE